MNLLKKSLALGGAVTAIALASAPANAALTISFPIGATSGFFGDGSLAPGSSYDQSQAFTVGGSGKGTFSISSTSDNFDITGAFVDSTPFSLTSVGVFDFGGLVKQLSAGSHILRVVGTVTAPPGSTGAFGGQITFVPTGSVPEPATWATMIGGLGIAGGMLRRRSRRTTGLAVA